MSQLSVVQTGKVGWMYLAHTELTERDTFSSILGPLLKKATNDTIEIQTAPENERTITQREEVTQRVVVIRCEFNKVELVQFFCTESFTDNSTLEI